MKQKNTATEKQPTIHNKGAQALRAWSDEMREHLKDENLPSDLSRNHDYYLWEEEREKLKQD